MMQSGADLFQGIDGTNTQKLQMVQLQFSKEVNQLREEIQDKHREVINLVDQLKQA